MDYRNPAECLDLLKRLNPVNSDETQAEITLILEGLLGSTAASNQHLEVLEAVRTPIDVVQEQLARRYAAHPLPPDSVENETPV